MNDTRVSMELDTDFPRSGHVKVRTGAESGESFHLLLIIWTVEAIVKSLVSVSLSCTETIFFFVRYMHTLLKRKILKCEKDW